MRYNIEQLIKLISAQRSQARKEISCHFYTTRERKRKNKGRIFTYIINAQ